MKLKTRPELVVFDCDGVLVNSEIPMHEELCEELQERGVDITFDECFEKFTGRSIDSVVKTAAELGAELPNNWKSILYDRVYARLKKGVDVVPGIPELVQRLLNENMSFCVVSNGSEQKMELMLSQHGLWDAFKSNCFSAHTIGVAKPNPGLLLHALKRMNSNRYNSVIIEDSIVGVQSAERAAVPCFIYAPEPHRSNHIHSYGHKFRSMSEISDAIFSLMQFD